MKKFKSSSFNAVMTALLAFLVFSFTACTQQSPLSPVKNQSEFTILQVGNGTVLNKLVSASQLVTTENGGKLEISTDRVQLTLNVLPESVSEDALLTLDMETQALDMKFGPHGTTFETPAILNVKAQGVDFSNVSLSNINFYYYNPEIGHWQVMARDSVIVNQVDGTVELINGRLPHFSRYAIGAE